MKKLLLLALFVISVGIYVKEHGGDSTIGDAAKNTGQTIQKSGRSSTAFSKSAHSTSDPASIWVVVNKTHPLNPVSYIPSDLVTPGIVLRAPGSGEMKLRKTPAGALESMITAAKKDDLNFMLVSGYRSYSLQSSLYNSYVKASGQAAADRESARAGYSEHQTGLAADVGSTDRTCELQQCFGNTLAGKWLASNAYKYGFIVRYPGGYESITGYNYEPWHVRYVGTDLSSEMRSTGSKTLEQFFGISGGTKYNSAN